MTDPSNTEDPSTKDALWEVWIVRHGSRSSRRSEVYLNYAFYDEPDDDFRLDYYFWILRSGDRLIHVDTGYSADGARKRGRNVLLDPLETMSALGAPADAGNPLVVTHAHYDHIGNAGAFMNSTIHISRTELEFWSSDLGQRPLFAHFGERSEVEELLRAREEGRVVEFDGEHELAPGVRLVEVGGHTPGQTIVEVDTAAGRVILASDAAHFHEELERDMLFQSMADLPASYRALDRLRAESAVIITGHDAGEIERFPVRSDLLPEQIAIVGRRDA